MSTCDSAIAETLNFTCPHQPLTYCAVAATAVLGDCTESLLIACLLFRRNDFLCLEVFVIM